MYITFEKLTGMKGTIEGVFIGDPDSIDVRLPIIYNPYDEKDGILKFRQGAKWITLEPTCPYHLMDYRNHFNMGINFLIKELRYGGGVRINSQNPN